MDKMLSMNPSERPDIQTILDHPYFAELEDSSNPFISPVRTPDKAEGFSSHQFFTEPSFGGESMPSFGSNMKDDSSNKGMEYSPVNKNDIFASGCHSSHKKAKSELNDGDSLPSDRKFSQSYEKGGFIKKAKSQHEFDNQEPGFGGFNISEFEDFKDQRKSSKSHIPMDDEITNTETVIDNIGDRSRKNNEESLPSFGSLVSETKSTETNRRKSQYVPKSQTLGDHKPSCFGKKQEQEEKFKNESGDAPDNYKFGEAPGFASFGKPF